MSAGGRQTMKDVLEKDYCIAIFSQGRATMQSESNAIKLIILNYKD